MKLKLSNAARSSTDRPAEKTLIADSIFDMEVRHSFDISSNRSGGDDVPLLEIEDDDLIEVTLSDGSRWYLGKEERDELAESLPTGKRGKSNDILTLGSALPARSTTRGVSDFLMNKLRILSIAPTAKNSLTDIVKELLEDASPTQAILAAADPAAFAIARKLEKKLATGGKTRLCKVELDENSQVRLDINGSLSSAFSDSGPTLLLLHGTLSSTHGSFSGLWQDNPRIFSQIHQFYQGRIIALEHCTLTESPISNTKILIDALPDSTQLHVISHSRGGLIGELLCRSERDVTPFDDREIELFEELMDLQDINNGLGAKATKALKKYHKVEQAELKELKKGLLAKSIVVERFVRVACPARGTTLASGKLHRWANRSLNAIGLVSGMTANPIYRAFEAFTLGIIGSSSRPDVLPGLQSMMPDSATVHLLNDSFTQDQQSDDNNKSTRKLVHSDLSVLAGDTQISGFNWRRIPLWLSDQFYGGEHDLVVNSASMDGGAARASGIRVNKVIGESVNHFSYFKNGDTAAQIARQLFSREDSDFELISQQSDAVIARGGNTKITGDRPMLFVVPGISGSKLSADGDRIWINPFRIAFGAMSRLSVDSEDVEATDLVKLAYGKFVAEFSKDHDVYCAPYDWRLSLELAAEKLGDQIDKALNSSDSESANQQPLRIVAHSMGGLVVRYLFAKRPDLWEYVKSVPGSRFIMAGTPNNGSYSINNLLMGKDKLARTIAGIDQVNDINDIVAILADYPGVATLLPGFGSNDWMQPDTWDQLKSDRSRTTSARISAKLLRIAREERRQVLSSPLDSDAVSYVAGHAEKTISDAVFEGDDAEEDLVYKYTPDGDGRVTWRDGIPGGLSAVWYQPTAHGALLAEPDYFEAWRELLDTGTTRLLPKSAPEPIISSQSRSSGIETAESDTGEAPVELDYLPTEDDLERTILDLDKPDTTSPSSMTPIHVTVSHGDLSFSTYPTVVGHFNDESIVHAEKALDRFLDYRLSERQRLGQYPGKLNSSEVVFRKGEGTYPEGALIVGLGDFGKLTIPRLERTLTSGIVKYILTFNEWWLGDASTSYSEKEIGLTFLLIGSGLGGLSVEESVKVIVDSVRKANTEFESNGRNDFKLVEQIEIVELYQDVAVKAAHAALLCNRPQDQISVARDLRLLSGGQRRTLISGNPERWLTLNIKKIHGNDEYQFEALHRSARSEVINELVDAKLVDQYLSLIMDKTDFDASKASSPYKTLFEILIPNDIKNASPDTDKLKLKLDEETARIPWEMLIDRWSPDQKPLVIAKKMMRQLSLERIRGRPELAKTKTALVVGDPPSGDEFYSLLPGARQEALNVNDKLIEHGFSVTPVIRESDEKDQGTEMAIEILNALTTGEYKILHLAGHGSYYRGGAESEEEADDEGMIIGKDMRLTPHLVSKMRRIPQVVFINCCHLGNIEKKEEDDFSIRHAHIASNLATQFIRNGALAVVAAAWEVLDEPAQLFAEVFYDHLLKNETLSESIHKARQEVYERHPDSNTFGAYQCWGDPMYRVNPSKPARTAGRRKDNFVSPDECADAANNIRMTAKSSNIADHSHLIERCDELLAFVSERYVDLSIPQPVSMYWTSSMTRALTLLGRAFGELGEFPKAIHLLRSALVLDLSLIHI